MQYAVVIEKAGENYSAYVPDLPGCIATGATVEEAEHEIKQAIHFHLDGLRQDGAPKLFTVAETAIFLRTPEATIRSWMSRGKLGQREGLVYVQSKPFFLVDVLTERLRNGELGSKKRVKRSSDL